MRIIRFLVVIIFFVFISCKPKNIDKTFRIYHLKPNDIGELKGYKENKKYYSLSRDDFFAIKNFDITNEQHKIKVDSFVVNYIKKDSFLLKTENSRWSLIFFKYGDGITEDTKHRFDTDYTIHNLFAFEKRIVYYAFGTRNKEGYKTTGYYFKGGDSIVGEKRKIITKFFKSWELLKKE